MTQEALKLALDALDLAQVLLEKKSSHHGKILDAYTAIKEALAQPEQDNTYTYASSLATTIWQKHYMKESPKFALLDTTEGVLTQIDNMTCGLVREKPAQPEQEPVAWRTFDGEGGYDYRSYEDNESYADDWDKRNPNHKGWVDKLYTQSQRTEQEPVAFEEWLANQHGDPEEVGFLQALRIAYISGQDSITTPPQRTEQEPVAWRRREVEGDWQYYGWEETGMTYEAVNRANKNGFECEAVPATPPQRTFVGLAAEDRLCAKYMQDAPDGIEAVIDYIEAKLKQMNGYAEEKNT